MKKNVQFVLLFISAFVKKHKKVLVIAIIFGFFTTLLFWQFYPYININTTKNIQKIGIIGRYTSTTLPLSIQKNISIGLTSLLANGEATPSLSLYWETSEDNKVYLFHIRSNLMWHDGTPFNINDINYRLKDIEIIPQNNLTLKVSLKEPFSPLPVILSQPIFKNNLIGLGNYKVLRSEYKNEYLSTLTLQAVNDIKPAKIIYKFYNNINEAIIGFKLGEVDILKDLLNLSDIKNWKNIKIKENKNYDKYLGIFFNLKNSIFREKEIRHALSYALPNFSDTEKVYSPISPLSWAYSKNVRIYNRDLDSAQKILSKNPISSVSTELTLSTFASYIDTAQSIIDSWNNLGLHVKLKVENNLNDDYQMFLLSQAIPADPDQYQYWQSTQENTNLSKYNNPKIDKLLEDGRKINDKEKRIKIYADFQRYLVDDLPVIFLFYPKSYTIERL